MSDIKPLDRGSLDRAVMTFARAFLPDPMITWVFPDAAGRLAGARALMRVLAEYGMRYGRIAASHDARAACVWIPPGPGITIPGMVRAGMLGVPLRTGLGPFVRFVAANEAMDKIHKARVPGPHWYLFGVAVDPELHGQGIGSAIIREGLALADRESLPCYLETSEPRNLAFYERFGFAVLEEATLGKGGPPAWAMLRPPQSTPA
ncbi:MAG: GNAT family N-acetyltransferase [Vicinamibacterales bacterium]